MIGFGKRMEDLGRQMMPGALVLLLVTVSTLNTGSPELSAVMPFFAVMAVYYWGVYWPEILPRWFVFLLGLFQDAAYGTPLGISSLLLLILQWVVTSQRRHLLKEPFITLWLMFGLSVMAYGAADWLMHCLYFRHVFLNDAVWMRLLLSVVLYPPVHTLFVRAHQAIMRRQSETGRRQAE